VNIDEMLKNSRAARRQHFEFAFGNYLLEVFNGLDEILNAFLDFLSSLLLFSFVNFALFVIVCLV
jgi:hypothetical protein